MGSNLGLRGSKLGILSEKLCVPIREQPEQGNCSGEISL